MFECVLAEEVCPQLERMSMAGKDSPMTEKDKRDAGMWYDAARDEELCALMLAAKDLCHDLNQARPSATARREAILDQLVPRRGANVTILSPFLCDYGDRITVGAGTFINHDAYLMDGGGIEIGTCCFIGPGCNIYTAIHPLVDDERRGGLEQAKGVRLCDGVWLGGNVTVLPGVTIGDGAVIGAGSVVARDVPPHTIALGNPCRPLRPITESDRIAQ